MGCVYEGIAKNETKVRHHKSNDNLSKILEFFPSTSGLSNENTIRFILIYKQTKNRHETGSNLSLDTRLTVLSKRLGRKRCCDATPDRCLGGVPSHNLRFAL